MTVSRPHRLAPGDEIGVNGSTYTVSALAVGTVALTGVTGRVMTLPVAGLFADPSVTLPTPARRRAPLAQRGVLEGLPADIIARAEWWERHVVELITGTPRASQPESAPRPEYDPLRRSLRQREVDKLAELHAAGEQVSMATLGRMRRRYQRDGLLGLVDGRIIKKSPDGPTDARLIASIEKAVAAETDESTGTVTRLRRRVEHQLTTEHGVDPAEVMPSRATFYRLARQVAEGRHTFGSAPTRRSLAQRPDGPFGAVAVVRPGEWMPIDSTPLDVRVVLDDGTIDRVELTWIIDIATRSIPAAVLRPTTKAVDASLLLARAVTPEPMRQRPPCRHCTLVRGHRLEPWCGHLPEDLVCHRHQLRIGDAHDRAEPGQPDLRHQPDILTANTRHRRLIRRHGRQAVQTAYQQASDICDRWHHLAMHDEDFRRLMALFHGPSWRARRTDPTVHAARYPQRVALTRLLVDPTWQMAARDSWPEPRTFIQEIRRTVAASYNWTLTSHYGTREPLAHLVTQRLRGTAPPHEASHRHAGVGRVWVDGVLGWA